MNIQNVASLAEQLEAMGFENSGYLRWFENAGH